LETLGLEVINDEMISKKETYEIIFKHDTKKGRLFDVVLLWLILINVLIVIIESIPQIQKDYFKYFYFFEWVFTIIFTVEYALRVWSSLNYQKYIFSMWGIIDLLAILPNYLALFLMGTHYLILIRILRLLRVFRVLRLVQFNREAQYMLQSIQKSAYKIGVFLTTVVFITAILGTIMYVIEGSENGFTSIPIGIYWAIVTLTTVGFGDIVPQTVLGKILASAAMILGYAIIAVPTGIVSSELMNEFQSQRKHDTHDFAIVCPNCKRKGHDRDANYCKQCGQAL
jgi:voltage-gated potassium channel